MRAFAALMEAWERGPWSDLEVWYAMAEYRKQMERENAEWGRKMADQQAALYGYKPRERQDVTPWWEALRD